MLNQWSMPINTGQCWIKISLLTQNGSIKINENQYRSILLNKDQNFSIKINADLYWEVLTGIDFHWSTLIFIDRHWCQCHKFGSLVIHFNWNFVGVTFESYNCLCWVNSSIYLLVEYLYVSLVWVFFRKNGNLVHFAPLDLCSSWSDHLNKCSWSLEQVINWLSQ